MSSSCVQVFIPIISFAPNVLLQIFSYRFLSKKLGLLKSIYVSFILGLFYLILSEFSIFFSKDISYKDYISIFIINLITYSALGYCYFHFINLGETARRIRILRELYNVKTGLSNEELLKRYNARIIIEKRIARLLNNGQIILKNDKYIIKKSAMGIIVKIIMFMKLLLLNQKIDSQSQNCVL